MTEIRGRLGLPCVGYDSDQRGMPVTRCHGQIPSLHPVTREPVSDESARASAEKYQHRRKARWLETDFVVVSFPFTRAHNGRIDELSQTPAALGQCHETVPGRSANA